MSVFTEEHEMFRKALRKMLEKEAYPFYARWEEERDIPRSFWEKLGENGFLCPMVSEKYGGMGVDFAYSAILTEELERVGASLASGIALHSDIVTPYIAGERDSHVFHQYTLRIVDADRDGLMQHLLDKGIPCAIYYPIPLHSQKAYLDSRYKEEDFPVTNQLVKEVISLPMHTELEDDQIQFVTDSILEFLK